jgi:hypothetical protein
MRSGRQHMKRRGLTIATLATAGALLAGGGTALADDGDKGARCDAFLAKVAEKRGVSIDQLTADLKAKAVARIDAAEKAGKLTEDQAAAKRAKVAAATGCKGLAKSLKKARGNAKHASIGAFGAATAYLEMSRKQLKTALAKGTTLAELAEATTGKSAAGLKNAMLAKMKVNLARAMERVSASDRLSAERKTAILKRLESFEDRLEQLVDRLVNHSFVKKTT